jgi:hypothetical protein
MELLDSTRNKITIHSAEDLADIAQVGPMEFETKLQP